MFELQVFLQHRHGYTSTKLQIICTFQIMLVYKDQKSLFCLDNVKMYRYAKFDQNIPGGSIVMSIFTKRPRPAESMPSEAPSPFSIPVAVQCKYKKYTKFDPNIPCGLRVMSIFTKC